MPEQTEFYDAIAGHYVASYLPGPARTAAELAFIRRTVPNPAARVLDYGCGTGRVCAALASHYSSVVGCDISAGMIAIARAALPAQALLVLPTETDLTPVAAYGPFDAVLLMHAVALHISAEQLLAVVPQISNMLVSGGVVVLDLPRRSFMASYEIGRSYDMDEHHSIRILSKSEGLLEHTDRRTKASCHMKFHDETELSAAFSGFDVRFFSGYEDAPGNRLVMVATKP